MTSSIRRGAASGCSALGEPGPGWGWGRWEPLELGGIQAALWLTGQASGGSLASDDGPLSDRSLGGFSLGKGRASWRSGHRKAAARAGGAHPGSVQPSPPPASPTPPGSWTRLRLFTRDSGFVFLSWNVFVWFAYHRGSAGHSLPSGSGESSCEWRGLAVLKRLVLLPREAPGCAHRGFVRGF